MSDHYNQNYTKEEIGQYLAEVKDCITSRRFTILQGPTRQKNVDFINQYQIRYTKQIDILNGVEIDDFCHTLISTNENHIGSILYVFVPQVELYNCDDEAEIVSVYIKTELFETSQGKRTVAISFHKLERPINYAYR